MIDLFTPVVPEQKLHPNFRSMLADPQEFARTELRRWAKGFPDRDGKFVIEFQKSYNSCFWELSLHACFRQLGCKCDYLVHAPDFVLDTGGGSLCVEQ